MDSGLVSTVIPTHRDTKTLSRAVQSVLSQSYDSIELAIVHEGSDQFPDEWFDADNILLLENRGAGVSAARNTGIEAADGEYIAFLDDDDRWNEEKIEKQIRGLEESDDSVLGSYTGIRQRGLDGEINATKTSAVEATDLLHSHAIGTFSNLVIRRSAIEHVGLLDEELQCWEDWDYHLRLFKSGTLDAVQSPLVDRYSGHGQLSDEYEPKLQASKRLWNKHANYAAEYSRGKSIFRGGLELELGKSAFNVGNYSAARRHFARACVKDSRRVAPWLLFATVVGGKYTFKPIQAAKRRLVGTVNR